MQRYHTGIPLLAVNVTPLLARAVGDGDCGTTLKAAAQAILTDCAAHYPLNSAVQTLKALGATIKTKCEWSTVLHAKQPSAERRCVSQARVRPGRSTTSCAMPRRPVFSPPSTRADMRIAVGLAWNCTPPRSIADWRVRR